MAGLSKGDINEREYWAIQAQKFAEVTGRPRKWRR